MLDRLSLTNVKAFQQADLQLGRLTLLTGLNSAGKSTVMQSLALLRQSYDAGTLTDDDEHGLLLNGELVELGTGRDVRREDYIDAGPGGEGIVLALDSGGTTYTWEAAYEREHDLLRLKSAPTASELTGLWLFEKGFQYLRADRMFPSVSYPRSHEVAIRRGFLGARGEHTVNYLRYYRDALVEHEQLRHPRADAATLFSQTEAWMQEICPGVNLEAEEITDTDSVRLGFRFGTAGPASSSRYRPTNVGFGLSYTLPIVVACLTAGPGSLVLLENPEAHLHPRGQTQMAFLACRAAAAGAQLVLETHSDHVLNGMRLAVKRGELAAENVRPHYFRRTEATFREASRVEIVTPEVGSDGMLSQWPEGFFDEWDESLDALLD